MKDISFTLDGRAVVAREGESIWQVARREGVAIPHLCFKDAPGYRADGNCRACVVEIEGERTLAASCVRKPTPGMAVRTTSERAEKGRAMVMELLLADQPARDSAPDAQSDFWRWVDAMGVAPVSRFPSRAQNAQDAAAPDRSHAAITVRLDACIQCGLCVRACREVQANDVIGLSHRNHHAKVTFDFDAAMGASTCVACGECVQACPTGALIEASLVDAAGKRTVYAERSVDTVCPYCGVGCQTRAGVAGERIVVVDGREGPANESRLCVKGRFGFDYIHHPDRLTVPLIRRDDAPKDATIQLARGG